jgi:NADP-dependent 3-hydroxy acid dehydrogenase YdfG/Flp pilus assembly protein TadD
MSKLILAYCIENQQVASQIAQSLSGKMDVEKIVFDQKNGIKLLEKQAQQSHAPVLILVSDNLLKNEVCMNDALRILQSLGNLKRLIPVTTEGVYSKSGNGQYQTVPTSFDRVSNVIQYMNYWQDQYLELRRAKPDGQDEQIFSDHVKGVRAISTEIGELLRYLRAIEYYSFDQFEESNFVILHRALGLEVSAEMERYKKTAISHTVTPEGRVESFSPPVNVPEPVREVVQATTPEPVLESAHTGAILESKNGHFSGGMNLEDILQNDKSQIESFQQPEVPLPDVDLNSIPGYSMVQNRGFQEPSQPVMPEITPEPQATETHQTNAQFQQYADELIQQGLDKPSTLESLIEELKNSNPAETEKIPTAQKSFDLTDLIQNTSSEDDKKVDEVLLNIQNQKPVIVDNNFTLSEADQKDGELVAFMEEQNRLRNIKLAQIKLAEQENTEGVKSKTDEDTIKQEVSRIFNQPEVETTGFDYEKHDLSSENGVNTVSETPNVENTDIPKVLDTEGPLEKSDLTIAYEALSSDPLNQTLRYQYAEVLIQNNRFQDAIEQLEILIEDDRKNIDAYMMMAYAAEQSGDYLLSLNCLEKVSLLNPEYAGIFYKLGNLVNEHFKNHKRKAHRYYKDAIHHDTQNSDAYYQLAMLDMEQNGNFEVGIDYLQKAVNLNPNHAYASFELAKAFYETGNKESAAHFYLKASENNPVFKTKINDDIFKFEVAEPEVTVNDNGKVVLITGATSGIGRATAEIFAKNGYRLVLTGRRFDRLEAVKAVFEEDYKNKIEILNFDVRNVAAVKYAVESLSEEFRNIDILINNAGLASGLAPIHEGDIADWELMIDTNIKGLLYMTRAIAPHMVNRKSGHIINVSSIAGKEVYPNGNVYVASKHAVDALTRAIRADLYKYNIRVSQVAPGMVEETEFALVRFHGDAEKAKIYDDIQPLKATDVADTIYYIASRPENVNIQDVVVMCTQQGSATLYDRSGRKNDE